MDEVSCFETLRIYNSKLFHFKDHAGRLRESCQGIGQTLPFTTTELTQWVLKSLKESGFKNALLRLSVHWSKDSGGVLVAWFREFKAYPKEIYEKGVSLKTAVPRRWTLKAQDPQIKASQFMSGVLAVLDKGEELAHELLLLGPSGTVAEGTVSNIFIVKKKRILTPSVSSGILRGVTRSLVIELAKKRKYEVLETFLTRHEIYSADECFMTNTSSEVLPVVSVDSRKIGCGKPGPITKLLAKDFKRNRSS